MMSRRSPRKNTGTLLNLVRLRRDDHEKQDELCGAKEANTIRNLELPFAAISCSAPSSADRPGPPVAPIKVKMEPSSNSSSSSDDQNVVLNSCERCGCEKPVESARDGSETPKTGDTCANCAFLKDLKVEMNGTDDISDSSNGAQPEPRSPSVGPTACGSGTTSNSAGSGRRTPLWYYKAESTRSAGSHGAPNLPFEICLRSDEAPDVLSEPDDSDTETAHSGSSPSFECRRRCVVTTGTWFPKCADAEGVGERDTRHPRHVPPRVDVQLWTDASGAQRPKPTVMLTPQVQSSKRRAIAPRPTPPVVFAVKTWQPKNNNVGDEQNATTSAASGDSAVRMKPVDLEVDDACSRSPPAKNGLLASRFACLVDDCRAVFSNRADLRAHCSSIHVGYRPLRCVLCSTRDSVSTQTSRIDFATHERITQHFNETHPSTPVIAIVNHNAAAEDTLETFLLQNTRILPGGGQDKRSA